MKRLFLFTTFLFLLSTPVVSAQSNFDVFFKTDNQYQDVLIIEVISADTFRIESGELVHLIGLKAPEAPRHERQQRDEYGFVIEKKATPLITIEDQAFEFAKELLLDQRVRLEFDVNKIGDKHITLAYAFLLDDDVFVNAEILKKGFADLSLRPPNTKYEEQLRTAYQAARKEFLGIHNE